MGCLPFFVPEEILHSAGMLPVTVCGDEYARGSSPNPWEILDGWVLPAVPGLPPETEDFLTETHAARPRISLRFPIRTMKVPSTEEALDRVEQLREWAGECSGKPSTDGALGKSIRIFNESRRLLSVFAGRLASDPGAFSARELLSILRSGLVLPREAHTELIQAALSRGPVRQPGSRARIFLGGWMPTLAALEAIDAAGGAVIGEAVAIGDRTPEAMVDEGGDPALGLARRLRSQLLGWVEPEVEPSWAARELDRAERQGANRFLFFGWVGDPQDRCRKLAAEAGRRGIPFLCLEGDPSSRAPEFHGERTATFVATGKCR